MNIEEDPKSVNSGELRVTRRGVLFATATLLSGAYTSATLWNMLSSSHDERNIVAYINHIHSECPQPNRQDTCILPGDDVQLTQFLEDTRRTTDRLAIRSIISSAVTAGFCLFGGLPTRHESGKSGLQRVDNDS